MNTRLGLVTRAVHNSILRRGSKGYDWYYKQIALDELTKKQQEYTKTLPKLPPLKEGHTRVRTFFDFATMSTSTETVDGENQNDPNTPETELETMKPIGRVVFELASDYLPKTCTNFIDLCHGTKESYDPEKKAGYKGTKIDQVLKDAFICGGDTTATSAPIFPFKDEAFIISHREGILSMNNGGSDSNTSHFFVTLKESYHLDGRNVAFGEVVEGMDVLRSIGGGLAMRGKLISEVVVADCGVVTI